MRLPRSRDEPGPPPKSRLLRFPGRLRWRGRIRVPAGVLVPAPGVIPTYPPGGVFGTSPSTVSPPALDTPSDLNEAPPKAKMVPLPNGSGTSSSTGSGVRGTSFYARRTSTPMAMQARRRQMGTPASTPVPTSRSARASSHPSADERAVSHDDNLLDHLPPLDLPGEVTRSAASPPTPPAAPANVKDPGTAPGDHTTQQEPAGSEADFRLTVAADPVPETAAAAGIGIARFASVNLNLAGGSLPSAAGLTWLADKGYRTIVDLRDSTEVSPSFIATVAKRGLRYVALPMNLETIDADHVARFQFEIGSADARPLFFFDSDGSRPGSLWYIRRLTVDKVDPQIARREAEEPRPRGQDGLARHNPLRGKTRGRAGESRRGAAQPGHSRDQCGDRASNRRSCGRCRSGSFRPSPDDNRTNRREHARPIRRAIRFHARRRTGSRPARRSREPLGQRLAPAPRYAFLAAAGSHAPHGLERPSGLLDEHRGAGHPLEGSGQSAGTEASTTIASPRVG